MANYVEITCAYCGKKHLKPKHHYDFAIRKGLTNFYCSRKCQIDARRKTITKTCKICGKEFNIVPSQDGRVFCCSASCGGKYRALKEGKNLKEKKVCELCGKEFYVKPSAINRKRGHFCSKKCYFESKKQNNKIKIFDDYAQIIVNSPKNGVHTVLVDKQSLEKIGDSVIGVRKHHTGSYYAMIYDRINKKSIKLHRFLTNCPEHLVVDHINHCTLDNRMSNLKICTNEENYKNQLEENILDIVKEYYKMKYYYKDFESA